MSLLDRFFERTERARPGPPQAALKRPAPRAPSGLRVYAVGDVHGCAGALGDLADLVKADMVAAMPTSALTVFLGDYVDRGPASRAVLDRLVAADWPTELVTLRGNHEDALLTFLEDPGFLSLWKSYGGLETLASYGVNARHALVADQVAEVHARFAAGFPAAHYAFLKTLPVAASYGDYFFCHAGVRPGVPLGEQSDLDLTTIRHVFLESGADHGKVVVHGHTPAERPQVLPNRIGVDTGAYATGRLTALVLEGAEQRFLATGPA